MAGNANFSHKECLKTKNNETKICVKKYNGHVCYMLSTIVIADMGKAISL